MNQSRLKELTKKYTEADENFRNVLGEYFVIYWQGQKPKEPKTLDKQGIDRIEKAEKKLEKARKNWIEALRTT